MERRVENLHRRSARRRRARERHVDVVNADRVDVFGRIAVVEAALELVTPAEEVGQVVLEVRDHLHAPAEHDLAARAVAVEHLRGAVGQRLEVGLLKQREVGVVVADLAVEKEAVADRRVVGHLRDDEGIELLRVGILRRRRVGAAIRLVVALLRDEALETIPRIELIADLAFAGQYVGRVLIARIGERRGHIRRHDSREARHLDVRRLIVEGAEEEELVLEERPAHLKVGVVEELGRVRVRTQTRLPQLGVDVLRLRRPALIRLKRRTREAIRAALCHHVDEDTARADRDILRARRDLDVLERRRHVVIHREALRRRVVDVHAVEHLRVLGVRRAARRERSLQSALVAADVG